ncbi:MAG TPA: hypothetical protein VJ783_04175, partial [Pirellulales bacterium]|nr:hypothetical protein [Pirellulales bacterium]
AAAATHYTVSAPASATAGTAFSITVTAQDQYANTATAYTGTVHFSSSDVQAALPVDSTLTSGVGTFSVMLKTSGNETITATDTVTGSITGTSGTIAVAAAAATHYTVGAPASAMAGTAFSITVTAQDQFGNTATAYAGTLHFTSSDSQAALPVDSTLTSGIGTFNVTLKTSGNQTITASDTVSGSITGSSSTVAVAAAAATHYTVGAPASTTAGTAFSITVTAQDQFGNTATAYGGIVHFTSSDGQAVLPTDSTLTSGVGTFNVTLKTSGNQTVTATDTLTATINGTSGTIAVAAAAATHYTVSATANATAGNAIPVTVTAKDPYGNTATAYSGTVHFSSSDGQAVLPADSALTSGVGTFSATLKTSGSETVTATDTLSGSITGAANVSVVPYVVTYFQLAAPAAATSGIEFEVTVTALDQFGNTATSYSGTVHFSSSDSTALLPADSTLVNGVGNFAITLEAIGSETVTVADSGSAAPPVTATLSVAIGSVPIAGFEFTPLRQVRVAHFGYNDDSLPGSAFQVTIDWGDGRQSAGTVVSVPGGYDVLGDHTFSDEGQFAATVSVSAGQPLGRIVDQASMLEALLPDGSRGTPQQRVVNELYRDLLSRQPDPLGLALWTERLDAGMPLTEVVLSIENTVEYRADEVLGVYERYLHRLPDQASLNYWTLVLLRGDTVEQLATQIIASPEYVLGRGGGTWHGFLSNLFLDALGRPIDATAEWNFTAWLAEGATPAQVASLLFSSAEYDAVLVDGFYERFLDRHADSSGMAVLAPAVASGETDEVIIARIIGDSTDEYELRVEP